MEENFQSYEEVVKFLEWLKSVKGQVYYVNWVKHAVRFERPFIKELDDVPNKLYYYTCAANK